MKLVQPKQREKRTLKLPKPHERIEAWFTSDNFTCADDFVNTGCVWCEPMLAKEISEEEREKNFHDPDYYVEEKFDGTRGILQFFSTSQQELLYPALSSSNTTRALLQVEGYTRCFSRRVSKKTGWFCENTDALPQLRNINVPELAGTVIDGELLPENGLFKDVSSTLNCLWDEAQRRQQETGKIVFHAFDIVQFKGMNCEQMPLEKRKELLQQVVTKCNSPYLVMVPYYDHDKILVKISGALYRKLSANPDNYSTLWAEVINQMTMTLTGPHAVKDIEWAKYKISRKAYYEYIVLCGGEGVIQKNKYGKYYHKRGKEYSKVKKWLTREVIITGFIPPTKEYEGKFPNDKWLYWLDKKGRKYDVSLAENQSAARLQRCGYIPVTRFYFYDLIGTIEYGVLVEKKDFNNIKKDALKTENFRQLIMKGDTVESYSAIVVGECSGLTDEEREYFTRNQHNLVGQVIEVKANELFRDTGKMRHPRYLRVRPDKDMRECTWESHVL